MTSPAPVPIPPPAPEIHWPPVFNGTGALVVRCDLDPDELLARIEAAGTQLTWIAVKINGTDIADDAETAHCVARWRAKGLNVGAWIWNFGPPANDVRDLQNWDNVAPGFPLPFVIYNTEQPYKADEGGNYAYAAQLVTEHHTRVPTLPAAVTSYGGYKSSIDFRSFANAGWPIYAQVYDYFQPGDELSYKAVYPDAGIHQLRRQLGVQVGQAIYRPESL